jgi:SAM-dependent methyltransferase
LKNSSSWKPSKFVNKGNKLVISKDTKEVNIGSRLAGNVIASFFDKYLRIYATGKLLDLGCGKVPLYEAYKDHIDENICVDWSGSFHKNEYLDYVHDINKRLPLDDNEFDTIILSDVLEHIENPTQLWNEMNRVLKKGGKLILNVPFFYWLHETPYDYYRFTEYALRKFANDTGFKIILLKPTCGIFEVLTDLMAKAFMYVPILGRLLSITIQSFGTFFSRTRIGQKISSKTSKVFPLGYFLIAEKS